MLMWYDKELTFTKNVLEKMNLQVIELEKDRTPDLQIDYGIRKFFHLEEEYDSLFLRKPFESEPQTIYKMTDRYLCSYLYLMLPGKPGTVLLLGPFMPVQFTYEDLLYEAERHNVSPQLFGELEDYYGRLPVISDSGFLYSVMNSLAEVLWGSSQSYRILDLKEDEMPLPPVPEEEAFTPTEKTLLTMEDLEKRYKYENEFLHAVTLGLLHKAELMLSSFSELSMKHRVADSLRNTKNYCIIMNTLMRKAAEQGSVHPVYLDNISSDFARRIEAASSSSATQKLMKEMVSSYCRLVSKHSRMNYSLPVRKTLVCIESSLSADLSLHALAQLQNLSSGYLSALFRKETGQTLTDYVNERRIRHAKHLLRTTALQIQTIAQFCGIPDANYFTKTFKRYSGTTPLEYRRTHQPGTDG